MLATIAALAISPVFAFAHSPVSSAGAGFAVIGQSQVPRAKQDNGQVLEDVFELLDEKYVRELGSEKLLDNALKAMFQGLDPHSVYLDPEEAKLLRANLEDKFGGIGVVLDPKPGDYPKVTARFLKAPAAQAGVEKGDLIVAVDGQATRGLSYEQIAGKLRGRIGTTVNLSIRRAGSEQDKAVSLRRATISLSSIRGLDSAERGYWLDESSKIGYMRISRFAEDTASGFKAAYARLKKAGVRALVIDLRSNTGGLLSAAVNIADIFVDSGLIVREVGRGGKEEKWMARKGEDATTPLAVLVDQDTASASEVLASCLQDHRRAVIVGERSYGKGSVQRLFKVGKSGAIVKLTTALYFPASGRHIDKLTKPEGSDAWGVSPDPELEVKLERVEKEGWLEKIFLRDDHVGTDMEVPAYDVAGDKVLVAARDALKIKMTAPDSPAHSGPYGT